VVATLAVSPECEIVTIFALFLATLDLCPSLPDRGHPCGRLHPCAIPGRIAAQPMDGPLFFLSYAWEDRDDDPVEVITRFYKALWIAVKKNTKLPDHAIGFIDRIDVKSGERWPDEVAKALQTCSCFVPVFSPRYFTRSYCGQEWTIFEERLAAASEAAGEAAGKPPLIQPVLFVGPHRIKDRPAVVSDIKYDDSTYPELYTAHGLDALVGNDGDPALNSFARVFADRLVSLVEEHPLRCGPTLRKLGDVQNAFERELSQAGPLQVVQTRNKSAGPNRAQVFFVAARPDELKGVRTTLDGYGEDAAEWQPWLPDVEEPVWRIVWRVAEKEGVMPLPDQFAEPTRIREAAESGTVVVVVADTWTLELPSYAKCMQEVDTFGHMNCVVAILWNERDPETVTSRDNLTELVEVVFKHHADEPDPYRFLAFISSAAQLEEQLARAISKARLRMAKAREKEARRAERGRRILQPVISGPRGDDV
jgi:FxsC-like protein